MLHYQKYLIPVFLGYSALFLPRSTLYIEDKIEIHGYSVDGVPTLLAKTASLISSLGYHITEAFELVFHTPGSMKYIQTGMIFGAETFIENENSLFRITNADLDKNLKNFAKHCALYDLATGQYTFDDIKKSGDLWKFLKEKTSPNRLVKLTRMNPSFEGQGKTIFEGGITSCKESIDQMAPYFEAEKSHLAKQEIIKNLPLRYQALTGMSLDTDELISQHLMIGILKDGLKGSKFASLRAQHQQRNTYQILGSLAGTSLVVMRTLFEALIYISFIFLAPMLVIPGGYKFLYNWLWMAFWIQLWPPFYTVLNYIMEISAQSRSEDLLFSGKTSTSLNYVDFVGLENFHQDLYALSGYLMLSVPFLSYALLKGGVSSLIHMAGSLMSPAYSAGGNAAVEQTTGNYSYGNISFGNSSLGNATQMQKNLAPSLSHGFMQENLGNQSRTYTSDSNLLQENTSKLLTGFISEESLAQGLNDSYQTASSLHENSQKMYQESLSSHERTSSDLINTLSQSENFSSGLAFREASDIQDSARNCQSIVKSVSESTGLGEQESLQWLLSAGASLFGTGITGSYEGNASANHHLGTSEASSMQSEFQENFQKLIDFSKSDAHSVLNEEGIRKSDAFSQSLDDVAMSSMQLQTSLSELEQISHQRSIYENDSARMTKNLDQDFVEFVSRKCGSFEKACEVIGSENREGLTGEFFETLTRKYQISMPRKEDLSNKYNSTSSFGLSKNQELQSLREISSNFESSNNLNQGFVPEKGKELQSGYNGFSQNSYKNPVKSEVENQSNLLSSKYEDEEDRGLFKRSPDLAVKRISMALPATPLWTSEEN